MRWMTWLVLGWIGFSGCAPEDGVLDAADGTRDLAEVVDLACYDSCLARGLSEDESVDICRNDRERHDPTCHDDCMDRGGTVEECRLACSEEHEEACYDECLDDGGDREDCRLRCEDDETRCRQEPTEEERSEDEERCR